MDGLGDWLWLIWLAAALAAGVAEVASLNLVFAMFAGGALVAAAAAGLTLPAPVQVIVFALTSVLLLLGVRPPLVRYARRALPDTFTGVAALVGRQAEVLARVTVTGGQVKLGGEVWSARTEDPAATLEIGSHVHVLRIDGATAVVTPITQQDPSP